ncbi:unnamed protein product [Paramecium octaurelia]|uniref:Uncharacterized protein n=1 Tax=Paramecium octaurelia TaxID=43137 RepID=A0A8S1W099_PAROT|nr:unnamed protein product [Paramecium octaurelia]
MNSSSKNGSTNNINSADNSQNQQQLVSTQMEYQKYAQAQAQTEIQYYIYQDLQNTINLMYARKAVLEYFKNNPTHEMITQSNNKLILQLNLSNTIHFDQQQQYKEQPQLLKFLKEERSKAYKILEKMIDNNGLFLNRNQSNDDVVPKYFKEYKQRYAKQEFKMNDQIPLQQTNQVTTFDEGVLSNIISSIQNTDNQIDQIRRNKSYKVPDPNEILQKANDYYKKAQGQLKNNFPNDQMSLENSISKDQKNGTCEDFMSEKLELINYLMFSGFFNDQTIQCNSQNVLQEWINSVKDQLILSQSQYNWVKEFYQEKVDFEYHLKLYYFFSIFFEYQQKSKGGYENQKIFIFQNCLMKSREQIMYKTKKFLQYLGQIEFSMGLSPQKPEILQDSSYIYELYQIFCDKRKCY